ncbi:MAG: nitroreductase family protein [Bacteroidia bacterium]|nr:nitroreductase family protein [Bacteroidia bacterium]
MFPQTTEVLPLFHARKSLYAFSDEPVSAETLSGLFEAARWAPSAFNEQPWAFVYATQAQPEAFARMVSLLLPGNQTWAGQAPVLLLVAAKTHLDRNGNPNRHALHDTGMATMSLLLQATAAGLMAHPMGGFDREQAEAALGLPAGYEAVTMIALGYPADYETLTPEQQQKEQRIRTRKAAETFVFSGVWGE